MLVADATVVKLHRVGVALSRHPEELQPRGGEAALGDERERNRAHKVKVTGERANDHRTLQMGPWVEGRLLLFDLGYFRYQLFDAIDRKADTSSPAWLPMPTRASWPRTVSGAGVPSSWWANGSRRWPGGGARHPRVEVEVAFKRRVYGGIRAPLGVVCAWSRSGFPRAPSIGSTSPTSIRTRSMHTPSPDLRGALANRAHLQGLKSHYRLEECRLAKRISSRPCCSAPHHVARQPPVLLAVQERLRRTSYKMPEQRWAAILPPPRQRSSISSCCRRGYRR